MSDWLLGAQRYLIAATVVLTGCLFVPALADPVNMIKLTVLALAAGLALVLAGLRVLRSRVVHFTRSWAAYGAIVLLGAFSIAAIQAPSTYRAVVGTYGRNSGLMAYVAALILFFIGARVWTASSAHILALALVVSGAFTASYGLLQYAGVDAIRWNNPYSPIIASLGNPDFASAYLGMCTPAAAWGAGWKRWHMPWRVISGVVAVMCLAAAVLSKAVQGPLAAAAGLGVLAAALLMERGTAGARKGLLGLGAAAGLALITLVAGAAKLGPAAPIFRRYSFQARQFYWDGALTMFRRHPVTGVGLDHYGVYWRQVRSDAATRLLGGTSYSDAAHSVPLQMFAQGGLLLGVAYALFVVAVAVTLVRGLRRVAGPTRLLLGAVGGTWVAYVVSSAVSIDQVPLLVIEFVTAGAVIGLSGAQLHEIRLPGAPPIAVATPGRRSRSGPVVRTRHVNGWDYSLGSIIIGAALVAAWLTMAPMRANAAAHRGDVALAYGNGAGALTAYQQATRVAPGEGVYWGKLGALLEAARQPGPALSVYRSGVNHDPHDLTLLLNAARLLQTRGDAAAAGRNFGAALTLDPTGPGTVQLAAAFVASHGEPGKAVAALRRAVRANPSNADLWAALGAASQHAGDTPAAVDAYQRALALRPDLAAAKQGLAALTNK